MKYKSNCMKHLNPKPLKPLTANQVEVLQMLRQQKCEFIAEVTERHWKQGKSYYIDDRVSVRGIRRKFDQGNREATNN